MRIVQWVKWIVLVGILAMSCMSDRTDRPDEDSGAKVGGGIPSDVTQAVQVYRGHAAYGHQLRSFRPCGENDTLWMIEPGDLLRTLHEQLTPKHVACQEVFAVVEASKIPVPNKGSGAEYSGALQIKAVLYAGLEGPGCQEDWNAFEFRVFGNEPFWSVVVSDRHIRLSRLGSEDRLWREITVEHTAEGIRYSASDATATPLQLIITREPCRDSMSGSYYAFSALLRVDDVELHGCALRGATVGERKSP